MANWRSVIPRLLRARPDALSGFLKTQRWFASKARNIVGVDVVDAVPIGEGLRAPGMIIARVGYSDADPEEYALLLGAAREESELATGPVPHFALPDEAGTKAVLIYDALWDPCTMTQLLEGIDSEQTWKGTRGEVAAERTRAFGRLRGSSQESLQPSILGAEQSNTSVRYGNRVILKLFRRLQEGINPEVEVGTFLTERTSFSHFAPVAAVLNYRRAGRVPVTLAVLQAFVPNQGDAWRYTLGELDHYFVRLERELSREAEPGSTWDFGGSPLCLAEKGVPAAAGSLVGAYLDRARLLGKRSAELHLALSSGTDDPAFAPEPFTMAYQESLYQSARDLAEQMLSLLSTHRLHWTGRVREQADRVLGHADRIMVRLHALVDHPIAAPRTRVHGDYHLGQVLCAGHDFVIIDFEGEPARSLEERRSKRSPVHDVAGMLRSFQYAALTALRTCVRRDTSEAAGSAALQTWAKSWQAWTSAAYLDSYLGVAGQNAFLPRRREDLDALLTASLVEKAVYELGYELNNRPDWVDIPLQGLLQLAYAE